MLIDLDMLLLSSSSLLFQDDCDSNDDFFEDAGDFEMSAAEAAAAVKAARAVQDAKAAAAAAAAGAGAGGKDMTESDIDISSFTTGTIQPGAISSIMKELTGYANATKTDPHALGYTAGPIGDEIAHWEIRIVRIPKDEPIWGDLKKLGCDHILMHLRFPDDYPFSPPFLRVITPRFAFRKGHVTLGGSVCMETLSNEGWNPMYRLEQIMVDVMATMISGEARLDLSNTTPYSEQEAVVAFNRMLQTHGWTHWKTKR